MKRYGWALLLAVVLHTVLVIWFCCHWSRLHMGNQSPRVISARVFSAVPQLHPSQPVYAPVSHVGHRGHFVHRSMAMIHRVPKLSQQLQPGAYNRLFMQLHDAIAAQLIYPEQSQWLQEQGTVVCAFVIEPSGALVQIHVKKSSGFTHLDRAAVDALHRVSPFLPAKNHFSTASSMEIAIRFSS